MALVDKKHPDTVAQAARAKSKMLLNITPSRSISRNTNYTKPALISKNHGVFPLAECQLMCPSLLHP
ncbi:hypothetical protein, partial [Staphylococcus aureus]